VVRRERPDDPPEVIWDGSKRLHGGLLCVEPERPRRPPEPMPDPPAVRPRGRPPRVPGSRATRKIEVRLTLAEARRVRELADEADCTIADLLRLTLLGAAADAGARAPVVLGRDVIRRIVAGQKDRAGGS
jgi:hypothetical protein